MNISEVMDVFHQAMLVVVKVAAPVLLISIVVGLVIAVFQAVTQIHEQTLTFVPKLLAIALVLLLLGPWMIEQTLDFMRYIFDVMLRLM
ncbi:MAG: flagellar biosynthesis protein FliQ [Oscillospiraceae bacterium]